MRELGPLAPTSIALDPIGFSRYRPITGAIDQVRFSTCRVYNSGTQPLTSGVAAKITFDSETEDLTGMHDVGSNTSRITFKIGGWYLVGATIAYDTSAVGLRYTEILLNNTTTLTGSRIVPCVGDNTITQLSTAYVFAPLDYIEVNVVQNSGGTLNSLSSGSFLPSFWAVPIYPN